MNIFWLADDMTHLFSILVLLLKIYTTKSCSGISFKMQELYALVFLTRYLDLLMDFISVYNSVMKVVFISTSIAIVWCMRYHPLIAIVSAACKNDPSNDEAKRVINLLYDTALISSGYTPDSPAKLGSKIYEMMVIALGGRWGRLVSEAVEEEADAEASTKVGSSETIEAEVVEPSKVRTESDPWKD